MDITVAIATIPPRQALLARALKSVADQTLQARAIVIAMDSDGAGAPATRQRALEMVQTEWVAFLDDDDEFLPMHLEVLATAAVEQNADYAYSHYFIRMPGGNVTEQDPVLGTFGKPFDHGHPHQTTVTTLVRTRLARAARCDNKASGNIHGQRAGEDYQFTLKCVALGAHIVHVPVRSWIWSHDSGNTSGRPWNRPEIWETGEV